MWIRGYLSALVTVLLAMAVVAIVIATYASGSSAYWMEMHPRTMDAINFGAMGWLIKLVWNE